MPNKSFTQLLQPWIDDLPDTQITSITLDHREIEKDSLFIAIQGHTIDARDYISAAIDAGASAVLADAGETTESYQIERIKGVPVVHFPHLKSALSNIAANFYQMPSQRLNVIGITGTNGKTTVSHLTAQWLNELGRKTALMGTTGNGFLSQLNVAKNTTASPVEIQKAFFDFTQQNATDVVMEVSSHGLVQDRVKAVEFDAAIFTNLSRDHLDYHGTMEAYAEAKLRLFTHYKTQVSVINGDDPVGSEWLMQMPEAIAVSMSASTLADFTGRKLWLVNANYLETGIHVQFDSSWGGGVFTLNLVGDFNVMNALLSLASMLGLGFEKQDLIDCAGQLKPVIGRMEVFSQVEKPILVVDYAHTPDALEKALLALRRHCDGKLWCVFGCGGDRDVGKRPMMAEIAEKLSDHVILTDDNPRNEPSDQIMNDMKRGLQVPEKAVVLHDRVKACSYAFEHAQANDIILIAGKGHEDYQITEKGTFHYSDRETALALIKGK